MRIILFFLASTLLTNSQLNAQTVQSSCVAHDSIVKKYKKDADRLAVRRVYYIGDTYKDSIQIKKSISKRYLEALIAVYNATMIPARDTVVKLYNIHTDLNPELNTLNVKATSTVNWMQQLYNNQSPTSNLTVLNLMNNYSMQFVYYQSTLYDQVVFKADTNANLLAMAKKFQALQGVISAAPEQGFNDTKNIQDSVNTNFIILRYSLGWGTCENGCDRRTYWNFKVFNDCSIEYKGRSGDTLFVGVPESISSLNDISVFPNPVSDQLNISGSGKVKVQITNSLGILVREVEFSESSSISLQDLAAGIYSLKISGEKGQQTKKIIKD